MGREMVFVQTLNILTEKRICVQILGIQYTIYQVTCQEYGLSVDFNQLDTRQKLWYTHWYTVYHIPKSLSSAKTKRFPEQTETGINRQRQTQEVVQ